MIPETCNSSPGNTNLRIGTQAGHDEDRHLNLYRKYVLRHTSSISPTHGTAISPFRLYVTPRRHSCFLPSYLPPPASFLLSPVIPASPGVIPAQAGILTRDAILRDIPLLTTTRKHHQGIT